MFFLNVTRPCNPNPPNTFEITYRFFFILLSSSHSKINYFRNEHPEISYTKFPFFLYAGPATHSPPNQKTILKIINVSSNLITSSSPTVLWPMILPSWNLNSLIGPRTFCSFCFYKAMMQKSETPAPLSRYPNLVAPIHLLLPFLVIKYSFEKSPKVFAPRKSPFLPPNTPILQPQSTEWTHHPSAHLNELLFLLPSGLGSAFLFGDLLSVPRDFDVLIWTVRAI